MPHQLHSPLDPTIPAPRFVRSPALVDVVRHDRILTFVAAAPTPHAERCPSFAARAQVAAAAWLDRHPAVRDAIDLVQFALELPDGERIYPVWEA